MVPGHLSNLKDKPEGAEDNGDGSKNEDKLPSDNEQGGDYDYDKYDLNGLIRRSRGYKYMFGNKEPSLRTRTENIGSLKRSPLEDKLPPDNEQGGKSDKDLSGGPEGT